MRNCGSCKGPGKGDQEPGLRPPVKRPVQEGCCFRGGVAAWQQKLPGRKDQVGRDKGDCGRQRLTQRVSVRQSQNADAHAQNDRDIGQNGDFEVARTRGRQWCDDDAEQDE